MNQNSTHNIVQKLIKTLFTTLIANQQLMKNIVRFREIKQSSWVVREMELLRLLEAQNRVQYFNPATIASIAKPAWEQLPHEQAINAAGFKVYLLEHFDEIEKFLSQEWGLAHSFFNNRSFCYQILTIFGQEYLAQCFAEYHPNPRNTHYTSIVTDAWKLN